MRVLRPAVGELRQPDLLLAERLAVRARGVLLVRRAERDVRPQDHHARPRVGAALDGSRRGGRRASRCRRSAARASRSRGSARRRPRRTTARCRPRSRCGCRRRSRSAGRAAGARRSTTPRPRRPPGGRRRSRCSRCGGRRSRGRAGCSARPACAPRAPSRSRCRRPVRAGRWSISTPGVSCRSGWPGRGRAPLAELLQVVERHAVAGQVQRRVLEDAGVAGRQHEAVAVGPVRIARVVPHLLLVEEVGDRRERHRRPGMARSSPSARRPWRACGWS